MSITISDRPTKNAGFRRVTAALVVLAASIVSVTLQSPQPAKALIACNTAAQNSYTMAPSHGKVFYIDSSVSPVLDSGYIGYRFTNATGATQSDLWVSVSNFVGGKLSLNNSADQYFRLPTLTTNSVGTAYFFLRATGGTTTAQSHDVKLFDGRPDLATSTLQYSCTYGFTKIQETLKTQTNQIVDNSGDSVAVKASSTIATLGETVTLIVEGSTGQIGNGSTPDGSIVWLTPAAVSSWPTRALRLESVSVVFDTNGVWTSTNDQVTFANQLLISNAKNTVNTSEYRATYVYRVIGRPNTTVRAVPVSQIASGTQVKHSDTSGAQASVDLSFSTFTVNANVGKSVTSSSGLATVSCSGTSCSSWGGVDGTTYLLVPYRLTATSTSSTNSTIDELVDVPSASAKFFTDATHKVQVTDVHNNNVVWDPPSYAASEANLVPRPQHFVGPFTFSSSKPATVDYWMAVPSVSGTYSNTAYALVGNTQVGSSASAMSQVNVTTNGSTTVSPVVTTQPFPVEVTTSPATSITTSGATLNGVADTNGATGLVAEFQYSLNQDLSSATTVTATTPSSGQLNTANDPSLLAVTLTGLSSYTTYYYRAKAGTTYGAVASFTTLGTVSTPTATTSDASPTSLTTAQLNGVINPNLTAIRGVQFLYGTSSALSTFSTVTVADPADATLPIALSGLSAQTVSYALPAGTLTTGTPYYYKVRACPNGSATISGFTCGSGFVDGSIVSFTTGTAPTVATASLPSTLVNAAYSATLTGTGGSGTYSSWALSGTLPSGLSLNTTTGVISGTTANNAVTSTFTVQVTDSLGVQSIAKSLTITVVAAKINQTITFSSINDQTFGLTPFGISPTSDSLLVVTVTSRTPTICDVVPSESGGYDVYMLSVGTCTLRGSQAGNATYNAATDVDRTFVISKKNQAITLSMPDRIFGDIDAFDSAATSDAASEGLSPTYSGGTANVCSITSSGRLTILGVGTCAVQVDYPGNSNYNAGSASTTFVIAKRNQVVTFSQSGKTFGDSAFTVTASTDATGGGSLSYSSSTTGICTVSGSTVTVVAAGDCTLTASHPGNDNWNSGSQAVTFAIAKKNQVVTFSQSGKTFGDSAFTVTASTDATGGGSLSYSSSTTGICTVSGSTVTVVAAGDCTLTASHPGNGNWNSGSQAVTFAIAKKNQAIVFNTADRRYGDANPPAPASTNATGAGSITYSSSTTSVCTVTNGVVDFLDTGDCTLTASHPGNGNWNSGSQAGTFRVIKGQPPLAFTQSNKNVGDPNFNVQATTTVSGGTFTYASSTTSVCTVSSTGVVTIVAEGVCTVVASYSGTTLWDADSITTSFSVTGIGATATTTTIPTVSATTTEAPAAPVTTPVTTPVVTPEATGSASGILWVDVNRNGKKDINEPAVPQAVVRLVNSGVATASIHYQSVRTFSLTTFTGQDGRYTFSGIPSGTYRVEADLVKEWGVALSSGSTINIQPTKETLVNVPAVGSGTLAGATVDVSSNKAIPDAKVNCKWAGFDEKLNTEDDVEISTVSNGKGQISLLGIPAGVFSCSWTNGKSGEVFDAQSIKVAPTTKAGSEPVFVTLKATSSEISRMAVLAATGSSSRQLMEYALQILGVGCALLLISRRRRTQNLQH